MNEEGKIGRCLEAIPARYPRIIVDSGSTDRTLRIAASHGCAIVANPWPGFAAQRNFALEQCGISTPWVLFVDADEIFPSRFFEWFEAELAASETIDAVMVPSILYLRGRRLSHAPGYPIYHPRLVHIDRVRFLTNHTGHGEGVPEHCRVILSDIPYDHYFYDGELLEWMHRHVEKAARLQPTRGAAMTRRGRLKRTHWAIPTAHSSAVLLSLCVAGRVSRWAGRPGIFSDVHLVRGDDLRLSMCTEREFWTASSTTASC